MAGSEMAEEADERALPELPQAVQLRLLAAEGWQELGDTDEALKELDGIPPSYRDSHEYLETSWMIRADRGNWVEALEIAERLVALSPERATGWIHRAYSLRRAPDGGIEKAKRSLLPAFKKFPSEPVIPYNLACYYCVLGDMSEAMEWFAVAMKCGDAKVIKSMAIEDEDLKPLWRRIKRL